MVETMYCETVKCGNMMVYNIFYLILLLWQSNLQKLLGTYLYPFGIVITDCSFNANFIKGGSLEKGNALEMIGMHLLLLLIFGRSIKNSKLRNWAVQYPVFSPRFGHIEVSLLGSHFQAISTFHFKSITPFAFQM